MHSPTVLVVDDDDDVRTTCAEVLRAAGYPVEEAENGMSALERIRSTDIGAIFLDVLMPRLGGLELLDRLDVPPPVALLTDHNYDTEVIARRSKVAIFLQKPVPPTVLLAAAARMFERSSAAAGRASMGAASA